MRHHPRALTLAAFALVLTACATNPSPSRRTSSARRATPVGSDCLDTLSASDSIATIVKMTVQPQDPRAKLPRDFEDLFAEEFRPSFKAPPKLPLSVVMGLEPCDSLGSRCAAGALTMGAVAYVTAYSDGTLSDPAIVDVSLTRTLTDNLRKALLNMSINQAVPWLGRVDSIPLVLTLALEEHPDTVPRARQVFKTIVPRYDVPFSYAAMPLAGVEARYPLNARLAGVGDTVTLAFTVESDGTIAPESMELVSADYRDFITSVLEALRKTHYHAAHLGDCAVATRMKQRFVFKEQK